MDTVIQGRLAGWEIHGFRTLEDLEVGNIFEEAPTRWLRPNEIHAILCNHNCFSINVKPVKLPKSGTIVLFDRKMLRNFRKDGHNWKKKKDGKTVKEAHEHLKVGDEERIHVYYAHGEDSPTFVRRCYWLLDKKLEHIVLVHYRDTQEVVHELQTLPVTPVNSHSSSTQSNLSATWLLSEENDSGADHAHHTGGTELPEERSYASLTNHVLRLHEINTLEWEDLLAATDPVNSTPLKREEVSCYKQLHQISVNDSEVNSCQFPFSNIQAQGSCFGTSVVTKTSSDFGTVSFETMEMQAKLNMQRKDPQIFGTGNALESLVKDGLQSQDSFGRWMNSELNDSPESVDKSSVSATDSSFICPAMDYNQISVSKPIFQITDISPAWGVSTEKTKILITGIIKAKQPQQAAYHKLLCVCGGEYITLEIVQDGVFRCMVPPHPPGLVDLYLSFDGHTPVSQIISFEYRKATHEQEVPSEDGLNPDLFPIQMRLAHLLFSTSNNFVMRSSKVPPKVLNEAYKFAGRSSVIGNTWIYLIKAIEDNKMSYSQVKGCLFELALKNRLQEWLLERIIEGGKVDDRDDHGRGVIHLCAILGYTWAAQMFSWSGISMDYRDKYGWTALHWAAYCGREKMVAALLSVGAKPNLVTDPTSKNHGGCNAADLASSKGYEGLAAYLAEKALVEQFKDMTVAGNVSGSLQINTTDSVDPRNLTEDELTLKDTLEAYRTAADAAARIQTAFREHSLKIRTKAVESSNPENEARNIVAALKIQHAFRNYETRKRMAAAAQIQYRFRTWKIRKEFLHMRRQAIKIQAAFRGFQVRRQYHKIVWSVGVLEKAILRWRLKRKGLRGHQVNPVEADASIEGRDSDTEEDFFRASRRQAEERVERSVVKVQAMFRSKQAQQQYRRMKLAHYEAKLELEMFMDPEFG